MFAGTENLLYKRPVLDQGMRRVRETRDPWSRVHLLIFFSLRNSDSRLRVKIPLSFLHYGGISDSCGACQFAAGVARENS
jgi:hypothetical protein